MINKFIDIFNHFKQNENHKVKESADKSKDQLAIKVSSFLRLENEIEVKIDTLKELQIAFHRTLMLSEPGLRGNEEVKIDLSNSDK